MKQQNFDIPNKQKRIQGFDKVIAEIDNYISAIQQVKKRFPEQIHISPDQLDILQKEIDKKIGYLNKSKRHDFSRMTYNGLSYDLSKYKGIPINVCGG